MTVYVPPTLYDAASAQGMDMSGYTKTKRIPTGGLVGRRATVIVLDGLDGAHLVTLANHGVADRSKGQ